MTMMTSSTTSNSTNTSNSTRYRRYPAYRASDVEWLGEIPAHWEAKAIKRISHFNYGDALAADDRVIEGDIEVFGSNGPVGHHNVANAQAPCLVIGRKGSFGKVNYSHYPVFAIDTTYYVDGRLTAANMRWLYYVLVDARLDAESKDSAIPGLDREDAYSKVICLPPFSEQRAIAAFLDRETTRIDDLIAKKERLIELLQEKRAAVITQAVTKGLDPTVPMKDSGVEWLGEVPAHWEVKPLLRCVIEKADYRGKTPEKTVTGVFLVTARNVRMGSIDYEVSQEYVSEADYDEIMHRGMPKVGDLLFTTEAPLGNVALVDREDIALAQRIIRFRIDPSRYDSQFVLFGMMSEYFQRQLSLLSTGSTAEGLKASKLPMLRIIVPPLEEQKVILVRLTRMVASIDMLIATIVQAIKGMRELRTSLISIAVTGKIDVREETTIAA